MKSSRQSRPNHQLIILTRWLLLTGGIGSCLWGLNQIFIIQSVNCTSQWGICEPALNDYVQQLRGRSIFFTKISEFVSQNPEFAQYELATYSKKLPSTVTLHFEQSQTAYKLQSADQVWLVNQQGKAVNHAPTDETIPVIQIEDENITQQLTTDSLDPELHAEFLALSQFMISKGLKVQAQFISQNTLLIQIPDLPQFVVEPKKIVIQLQKMLMVINNIADIPTQAKQVDLRFKNPVVKNYTYQDTPSEFENELLEELSPVASDSSESSSTQSP